MIEFVEPSAEDLLYLADNLREEDKREILTLRPDADLHKVLQSCVKHSSVCRIVKKDGVPVVIFGSQDTEDMFGLNAKAADIWLVGTDDIKLNKMSFLKLSKKVIEEIAGSCDYLWNVVDPRNELHIRWLEWLGFSFPMKHKVNDEVSFLVALRYT